MVLEVNWPPACHLKWLFDSYQESGVLDNDIISTGLCWPHQTTWLRTHRPHKPHYGCPSCFSIDSVLWWPLDKSSQPHQQPFLRLLNTFYKVESLLSQMMGDESKDTSISDNLFNWIISSILHLFRGLEFLFSWSTFWKKVSFKARLRFLFVLLKKFLLCFAISKVHLLMFRWWK